MKENIKPEKIKKDNKQKKIVITLSVITVLLLAGIYLFTSFATFQENKKFNVINGTVEDPGDIYFAYYVDNTITRNLPSKDSGYTLDTSKSNCTNGVTVGWDQDNWTALVNYSNYSATDYTRTKCNLYFKVKPPMVSEYITKLSQTDTTNLATDDYGNTRYIGADPNNYVSIDGDIWRIIGTMKDVDDGTGNKSDRAKIIRNESIGEYSWDTSASGDSSLNSGMGVNEWSQADLMKLLNPGYEDEEVGGSLYWNSQLGTCYNSSKNGTTSCNFTSTGIKDKLKTLISDAVWNTGASTKSSQIASKWYTEERGSENGKICISGNYCTDTVERTTTWTGKVGLMYPSDYGYATSGGSTNDRVTCLNTNLSNWHNYSDCKNNDWLFKNSFQWTLSPGAYYSGASDVFRVRLDGYVQDVDAYFNNAARPVVYLSSNVKISGGEGTSELPYQLEQ